MSVPRSLADASEAWGSEVRSEGILPRRGLKSGTSDLRGSGPARTRACAQGPTRSEPSQKGLGKIGAGSDLPALAQSRPAPVPEGAIPAPRRSFRGKAHNPKKVGKARDPKKPRHPNFWTCSGTNKGEKKGPCRCICSLARINADRGIRGSEFMPKMMKIFHVSVKGICNRENGQERSRLRACSNDNNC